MNTAASISRKLAVLESVLNIMPEAGEIFVQNEDIEEVRKKLRNLAQTIEEYLDDEMPVLHPLERINIKDALMVFRNFLSKRNEKLSGHSVISLVHQAIHGDEETLGMLNQDFFDELKYLFRGMRGLSGLYPPDTVTGKLKEPEHLKLKGRKAALARCRFLDEIAESAQESIRRFPTGLDKDVWQRRRDNVRKILAYFNGTEQDWSDYLWHLKNSIKDSETLGKLVDLSDEERSAIDAAKEKKIPFGITPFYASLMDKEAHRKFDHAVRAQVIPPASYVDNFRFKNREKMDFMRESDTSPVDLVTRRYPMIAIFKPFNTCAQICVYCQRNWEINDVGFSCAMASEEKLEAAMEWFKDNPSVKAILITGGDPLVMHDTEIRNLLHRFSKIPHIQRIRFGTRTPVVLPSRFTASLIDILDEFHIPGKREICIVTHFEHPYEVTPEAMEAVQEVKRRTSINFYNQQVFTIENSRRFETVALRLALKNIGIDPYYIFHAKGKKETEHYIVPLARLLQERKEEARLAPGLVRTDESVYNIPGVGKNHLRAKQDHELIMLTPEGRRIYEMHPWEKAIAISSTYIYEDVSIGTYLSRLAERGENPEDYRSIWYYY